MDPLVTIVILNWNGRDFLKKFLPSVLASTFPNFRVVVVDNASDDDSVAFLMEFYPSIEIISHPANWGFARGYHEALKILHADYFVLLNSDVEVSPGWIEPVIELMEANKRIAACQSKMLQYDNRSFFEYAGACGGWIDLFGYPFARGRIFDVCERDEGQYDSTEPVFWACGAAMFVRSSAYSESGGLDPWFFAHQEEIDLCWRLQRLGYLVYSCHTSVVYHLGGGTLPKGNSRKVFLNFRNNLIMMAKNLPFGESLWKVPLRMGLDIVSAFKTLFSGEFHYLPAIFKAHCAFVYWIISHRPAPLRAGRSMVDLKGYTRHSIVWAHFIKGRRYFSEILDKNE